MNSQVFDWDDIDGSLRRNLGGNSAGWIALASKHLAEIKRFAKAPEDLPQFTQIKEKLGELRLYTSGGHEFESTLRRITSLSSNTCEVCGNAARTQNIDGTLITLCCFCHGDARARTSSRTKRTANNSTPIDISDKYEHLVAEGASELFADVQPGWSQLLSHCLNRICGQVKRHQGGIHVEISKISRENGELNIVLEKSHPDIDGIVSEYQSLSKLTCVDCGYYGQIARGRHSRLGICPSCLTLSAR